MTRASENELSALHGEVAKAMSAALKSASGASHLLAYYDAEETHERIPSLIREYLENQAVVPPSLLTAITKFLKDNEVTAQPGDDAQSDLQKKLATRQRASTNVVPFSE